MLKNYIKIAWRNLVKGKLYSVINILGLAIGIACCLLIGLYVFEEFRYDRFHEDADQLYRVNLTLSNESKSTTLATTPRPLAAMLKEQFPEVENVTSVEYEDGVIRSKMELSEVTFSVTDSSFFDIFDFNVLAGDAKRVLQSPNEILISSSLGTKLFGEENPLGKVIDVRIEGEFYPATIAAIVQDAPSYSSINFEILVPQVFWNKAYSENSRSSNWGTMAGICYVKLTPGSDAQQLSRQVTSTLKEQLPEHLSANRTYSFQNLTDIHFGDQVMWSNTATVDPNFVLIAVIIAVLILVISCINFTSLSIGQSVRRAKEVGMRKVIGAERRQLFTQFLGETFFVALFSFFFGLLLAELLLPHFSDLVNKPLDRSLFSHPAIFGIISAIVLLTGILTGSYPALYLSKFEPSQVFRHQDISLSKHRLIPVLTTIQFALAITLIIGTVFMNQQMSLLSEKNLGFNEEHVIQIETPYKEGEKILQSMKNQLSSNSNIRGISASWNSLDGEGVGFDHTPFTSEGQEIRASKFGIASNLTEVLDIEIKRGGNLSENSLQKSPKEVLVNQSLVNAFEWKNPIGKRIEDYFGDSQIVHGVVEDFHFESLHQEISPLILVPDNNFTKIYLRLNRDNLSSSLDGVKEAWNTSAPGIPFQFSFLDDKINQQYLSDQQWVSIVQASSILAILISCLGLFGLATLSSSRRKKEVSVRKVFGATISSIVLLLSRDFLKPVLLGLLISIPIAFYLMNQWLQDFAFRIDLEPKIFFITGIGAIIISLLTVSWQSIKAAIANPADSLRSE